MPTRNPNTRPSRLTRLTRLTHLTRLPPVLHRAAVLLLAGLIILLLLITAEFLVIRHTRGAPGNPWALVAASWLNGALTWTECCPVLLILTLAVGCCSVRAARYVPPTLITLLLLAQLALTVYFSTALVPLGADLYGYSWKDIRQTVGSAGGLSWGAVTMITVLILGILVLLRYTGKRAARSATPKPWLAAAMAGTGLTLTIIGWPGLSYGGTEFTRNLTLDKPGFFLRETAVYLFPAPASTEPDIYADSYLPAAGTPGVTRRHYLAPDDYPFLTSDTAADVLTPFFRPGGSQPPHLVIIMVEGLGRAFTGDGAYLGSFTPFLDSLSRHSLYWDNFLSEGGRTFAALPSLLGSLPFATNGYLALGDSMPPPLSLDRILQANGYHTSFYYGGDARFDNMAEFLRRTRIDELRDGATFPAGYTRIPARDGFSWGYNDRELFRWWLSSRPAAAAAPQLSILLTVSTHSPFLLNDPAPAYARFDHRVAALGFDQPTRRDHETYRDQYASILYTDNALRDFFTAYSRRPDFAHTVFIITGDHRMPEIPMRDKIDRFHVPLIIYSPLLSRPAVFHSVSTHFDLAPSLLAWLAHSYRLSIPTGSAWLGDGLDTTKAFHNSHSYPLMQTKTDLVDFIEGDSHLNGETLFRLHPDLSEDAVPEDSLREALIVGMDAYRQRNARWLISRKCWPDTVVHRFGR